MNSGIQFAKNVTATGLGVAAVYGAALVALRARRAWKNMKIIQSVDTGSVWTTE
ncbi:hypothetical protein [Glaciibacter sp. 2TAF33]|uniref:hypothetical protein n=1 Tax=Glaciibacter sp. 2TAF33 TaxID=3233015 RepID=UPI003F9336FA